MARASGAPMLHVAVAWSARPGEAREVGVELPAGANVLDAIRASGAMDGRARRSTSRPRRSASGAAPSRSMRALAEGDRVEIYRPLLMDPKEARRRRAQRRKIVERAAARYFGQSAAITSLACLVSSARCLSSRILALALLVGAGDAHAALEGAQLRLGAAAVVGLGGGDAVFLGLVLRVRPRPRPSCAWPRAPDRRAFGGERAGGRGGADARRARPTPPGRPAARHAARRGALGRDRMSCVGRAGRRRQVAVLDAAALVLPLPLRFGRQRNEHEHGRGGGHAPCERRYLSP